MRVCSRYGGILLLLSLGVSTAVHLCADSKPETHITSDTLEVDSSHLERTLFVFQGNVSVKSPHLQATCDHMEVLLERRIGASNDHQAHDIEGIDKVTAVGSVTIKEKERTATAGQAEIYPKEGRIVLSDNPVVQDKEGTLRGYRMTLYRSERRAVVEGAPGGQRPTVTLPALPDFSFKPDGEPGSVE